MHPLKLITTLTLLLSACSPSDSGTASETGTTAGTTPEATTTAPVTTTASEATTDGSASHASHETHETSATGESGSETAAVTTETTHATHDTHDTTSDPDTTAGSTGSSSTTGGGAPAPIDEYCACMLENCHDQYHGTWGEDHRAAEAMCAAYAESVPSVGMPAMSGDSLECRLHFCEIGHDDPTACDSALGDAPCK